MLFLPLEDLQWRRTLAQKKAFGSWYRFFSRHTNNLSTYTNVVVTVPPSDPHVLLLLPILWTIQIQHTHSPDVLSTCISHLALRWLWTQSITL
jgi:hypothetical protein